MAEKGRGNWLKGLLIKEGDESTPKQETTVNPNLQFQARYTGQPTINPVNPTVAPPVMVAADDTPDQAYLDHLYKFMEDQNIPGPDYFEYANTLHEMGQMAGGIPEANLYQLAYVGLKAQGVTPVQLVQTAGKYISMFEKHKTEFETYLSQEGSAQVTAKANEIQSLQQQNDGAEAKINELTQQIQQLQQSMVLNSKKISENNEFINTESQKIAVKKTKFEKAYQIVVDKVNGDIAKIQNYVK